MSIDSYRDLVVWQRSMDLVVQCYRISGHFPASEMYGLTGQIRRAAVSIPANIAEGHGRDSTGSFVQFLRVSQGSIKELETHLILAARLGFIDEEACTRLLTEADEIGRMMRNLIRRLQDKKQ